MNIINVESGKINNIGNNLIEKSDIFEKETNKIKSNIEKILDIWDGEDAQKYTKEVLEKYIPILNELAIIIRKNGTYFKLVDSTYNKLDTEFSEQELKF